MRSNADYPVRRSWGEALRRRRNQKELSQIALAYKAGLSTSIASSYERGGVVPSIIMGQKIAKALDWTVEEWAAEAAKIEADGSWYRERFDYKYEQLQPK